MNAARSFGIEVRSFSSLEALEFLREGVNALNLESARPDPFSTYEFYANYVRHDEDTAKAERSGLWFLTAFDGERLIGYLALKTVTQKTLGLPSSILGFLVTHDGDRPHLVARPVDEHQVAAAFYAYVLGRRQEWTLLELHQQDEASPSFPPAGTALDGFRAHRWPSLDNCTVHIRWDSLREYFGTLSKKFRADLARQMRRLLAAGDVQLLGSSDPAVTPTLMELYLGIERHSWKSQARAGIGRHPARIEYVKGLLDAGQPMRVSIQILLLDGAPIAGLVCGAFLQNLYALHIVYDDRVRGLAPGSAMLLFGMRQAIAGGYAAFNLLSGFDYYKTRWLAQVTETHNVQLYRRGTILFWRRIAGDLKRAVSTDHATRPRGLFNPARRAVVGRGQKQAAADAMSATESSNERRRRIDTLKDAIGEGRGERLEGAQLASELHFIVRPAPGVEAKMAYTRNVAGGRGCS